MKVKLTTSHGEITIELNPEKAPATVENFLNYVRNDQYVGTIFHRVIDDFMIQAGGLDAEMNTKPTGEPVKNEANNGLSNLEGTIAMARTADPHSASAQFFINTSDNAFLDFRSETQEGWGYCVFGQVVDGMDVVEKIEAVETTHRGGHQDVPVENIEIQQAEILEE